MCPSTPPAEFMSKPAPILLVGHRGVGKSTLGRLAASQLGRPFVDLDRYIAEHTGLPVADLVTRDIETFRSTEARHARSLAARGDAPIIAAGAGLTAFPAGALIVWIEREGWQATVVQSDRPRVRPDLSLDDEHRWMIATREPRWQAAAHLKLSIPGTRTPERAADDLTTLLNWAAQIPRSPLAPRTALVPLNAADLTRALHDRALLGLGRVELRSDVFPDLPAPT